MTTPPNPDDTMARQADVRVIQHADVSVTPPAPAGWVSLREAAADLGCSVAALRRAYRAGQLPTRLVEGPRGQEYRVQLEAAHRVMAARTVGAVLVAQVVPSADELPLPGMPEPPAQNESSTGLSADPDPAGTLARHGDDRVGRQGAGTVTVTVTDPDAGAGTLPVAEWRRLLERADEQLAAERAEAGAARGPAAPRPRQLPPGTGRQPRSGSETRPGGICWRSSEPEQRMRPPSSICAPASRSWSPPPSPPAGRHLRARARARSPRA